MKTATPIEEQRWLTRATAQRHANRLNDASLNGLWVIGNEWTGPTERLLWFVEDLTKYDLAGRRNVGAGK